MQESPEHEAAKKRIRDLARARGHIAENEVTFTSFSPYHKRVIPYTCDIFIFTGRHPTLVEIDGYKGHDSKYKLNRDERRTRDIQDHWDNDIRVCRFRIDKETGEIPETDEEIEKKLGLVE